MKQPKNDFFLIALIKDLFIPIIEMISSPAWNDRQE